MFMMMHVYDSETNSSSWSLDVYDDVYFMIVKPVVAVATLQQQQYQQKQQQEQQQQQQQHQELQNKILSMMNGTSAPPGNLVTL